MLISKCNQVLLAMRQIIDTFEVTFSVFVFFSLFVQQTMQISISITLFWEKGAGEKKLYIYMFCIYGYSGYVYKSC